MRRIRVLFQWGAICIVMLMLQGCSMNRTGDDWLELVHAGITAEDDFRFTGSVAMGFEEGPDLTPYSFEGTISAHHQVALYAEQNSSLIRNPIHELDFLVNNYENAEVKYDGLDESTEHHVIILEVHATEEAATKRLKEQLGQELSNVTLQAVAQAEKGGKHIDTIRKESSLAENELDQILKTLTVNLTYTITIDALKVKPLKMDENMIIKYEKDQSVLSEYRKTAIIFDMSALTEP